MGWYDEAFLRDWTNSPLLVRADTGRLLRLSDVAADGSHETLIAWDGTAHRTVTYEPGASRYATETTRLALFGWFEVEI